MGPLMIPPDMDARLDRDIERIPAHCREGFLAYLRYGQRPGGFLHAVLANNLRRACSLADDENRIALYNYIYLLDNDAPSEAWGSAENVAAWLQRGADLRQAELRRVAEVQ